MQDPEDPAALGLLTAYDSDKSVERSATPATNGSHLWLQLLPSSLLIVCCGGLRQVLRTARACAASCCISHLQHALLWGDAVDLTTVPAML